MPVPQRPVFVDPSGRRRRVVRIVAVLGAVLTVGYLAIVLVAAFGGPASPAGRLPLLPDGPVAAVPGAGTPAVVPTGGATPTGPVPTSGRPGGDTARSGAATPVPAATTSKRGRAPGRTDPPGNGGRPTDPPGNGG